MGKASVALAGLCLVAGCAVVEQQYPTSWEPLVPQPDGDCRQFEGRYADRGERTDEPTQPSLTRQLFGELSDWENASTVQLSMPKDGALVVTVLGTDKAVLVSRTLLRDDREFDCRGGRLIIRDKRWIFGYVISGRQHMELDLNHAGRKIAVHVEELAYGVMFAFVPAAGTARHWYRFERLP